MTIKEVPKHLNLFFIIWKFIFVYGYYVYLGVVSLYDFFLILDHSHICQLPVKDSKLAQLLQTGLQATGIPQVILGLVHVPDLHHDLGLGGCRAVLPSIVGIANTRRSVTCVG